MLSGPQPSGRPTTSTATPASTPNMGGGGPGRDGFGGLRRGLRRHLRRHLRRRRGAAARRRPAGVPRRDLSYAMEITLERSRHGKAQIRIPSWDDCDTCHGTGAKPGTSPITCTTCHGRCGADAPGLLQRAADLPTAAAPARSSRTLHRCHGQGKIKNQKTLGEDSPPASTRACASSTGNGEPGTNGGPPATSTSRSAKKHDIFERDGELGGAISADAGQQGRHRKDSKAPSRQDLSPCGKGHQGVRKGRPLLPRAGGTPINHRAPAQTAQGTRRILPARPTSTRRMRKAGRIGSRTCSLGPSGRRRTTR